MTKDELLKKLKGLGIKNVKVEKDLGMPKNCLSGLYAGKKVLPDKYVPKIENYISKNQLKESIPGLKVASEIEPDGKIYIKKGNTLIDKEIGEVFGSPAPDLTSTPQPIFGLLGSTKWHDFKTIQPAWVIKTEVYCGENEITPEDLIDFHKKYSGQAKNPNPTKPSMSDWRKDYIKKKTGVTE